MAQALKILLVHRYFWPDTPPYAVILKKIAGRLAADGHDVTVLSAQPSYKPEFRLDRQDSVETIDGFTVVRVPLTGGQSGSVVFKILNMFLFPLLVMFHALKKRDYDLVMISTSPPVLAGLAGRVSARICNARFYYHCMDIHPEIGRLAGNFSNKFLFRVLQKVDEGTCRAADKVLVLSDDMKGALEERSSELAGNIEIIQNFDLDHSLENPNGLEVQFAKPDGVLRIIFAGNIGRFQGLEKFLDQFLALDIQDKFELVFLGNGQIKNHLKNRVKESGRQNVRFIAHQPMSKAKAIIATADLGLVTLSPGVYKYAYPTKVIAYLSVGCPLLVIMEPESAMASFVQQREIGLCLAPGDNERLSDELDSIASGSNKLDSLKENAAITYGTFYNETNVLNRWSELVANSLTIVNT